jgi:hypothetical protein
VLALKCTSLENKAFKSILNKLCLMYCSENETAISTFILNFCHLPWRQRKKVLLRVLVPTYDTPQCCKTTETFTTM